MLEGRLVAPARRSPPPATSPFWPRPRARSAALGKLPRCRSGRTRRCWRVPERAASLPARARCRATCPPPPSASPARSRFPAVDSRRGHLRAPAPPPREHTQRPRPRRTRRSWVTACLPGHGGRARETSRRRRAARRANPQGPTTADRPCGLGWWGARLTPLTYNRQRSPGPAVSPSIERTDRPGPAATLKRRFRTSSAVAPAGGWAIVAAATGALPRFRVTLMPTGPVAPPGLEPTPAERCCGDGQAGDQVSESKRGQQVKVMSGRDLRTPPSRRFLRSHLCR